ncbi:hypothetical protein SAMN02745866_04075 [Alteromonadaceae bacterium Bs31]|nr:hypothetical protein SAMN02745866_04075 [Alteromonadaceae bacterium Bs31]
MKKYILALIIICPSIFAGELTPREVVNKRVSAHNSHNLEEFLSTYSEDVRIGASDCDAFAKGKAHIKKVFFPLFKNGTVHLTVHSQMVNGPYVVNRETLIRNGQKREYVSVYEVRDGLIKSINIMSND